MKQFTVTDMKGKIYTITAPRGKNFMEGNVAHGKDFAKKNDPELFRHYMFDNIIVEVREIR